MKTDSLNLYLVRVFTFFLIILFLISSCKKDDENQNDNKNDDDPLKPKPAVVTTVTGVARNEEGDPIAGAAVNIGGKTTLTSSDGTFTLADINVPGNRIVVTCEKEGFFPAIKAEMPRKDGTTSFSFYLMSDAVTHSLQSSVGGLAALSNGSSVQFPANGFVTSDGSNYNGTVNLSIKYLDPSSRSFGALVPGGDMLAMRTDESTSILYSYGILRVKLTDAQGNELQLAEGKTSTLTISIPDDQMASSPETIPLWYFDNEKGVWIEEGLAKREGDKYVGTVTHFTDWNADDPKERATVIGEVVDCKGEPIVEGEVFVGQSSSNLSNGVKINNWENPDKPHTTGFEIDVPSDTPLMVILPNPSTLGGKPFGDDGGNMILVPVPPLKPGQVFDVGQIKPHPCPSSATGSFKTKAGDEVESVSFKIIDGGSDQTINGNTLSVFKPLKTFNFNFLPPNAVVSLSATTKKGDRVEKVINTSGPGENINIGEINFDVALVTVTGIVSCQNSPVASATISAKWQEDFEVATSNGSGVYSFSAPPAETITLSISHSKGRKTIVITTPASGIYKVGATDICESTATLNENSFVMNDFKRTLITEPGSHFASYQQNDNSTTISIADKTDTLTIGFQFEGKAVGEVAGAKVLSGLVGRKVNNKWVNYIAGKGISEKITITVTKYENVGGLVEGEFRGTFLDPKGLEVEIIGKFSTIRAF